MRRFGGIMLCGLNGSGKTTLGRETAERLQIPHLDAEDYYFPNPEQAYAVSRTREEVCALLLRDLEQYGAFVFSAVNGDWGDAITSRFALAAILSAPAEVRLARVRQRSLEKFGERILPGGDLQEREEEFFRFVASRTEEKIEEWLKRCSCPVVRLDGERPIAENAAYLAETYRKIVRMECLK